MTDEIFRRDEEPVRMLGRRSLMSAVKDKNHKMAKTRQMAMSEPPAQKKPRTSEDFKLFCQFILAYENYDSDKEESHGAIVNAAEDPVENEIIITDAADKESEEEDAGDKQIVEQEVVVTANEVLEKEEPEVELKKALRIKRSRTQPPMIQTQTRIRTRTQSQNQSQTQTPQTRTRTRKINQMVIDSTSDSDLDTITCFCGKPFAGRPMVECSKCLNWVHIRCVKVKKSEIPEIFLCTQCKEDTSKK